MDMSARLCRAQEAAQRERAASATLENVRVIAERAADAWGREALEAEGRETRRAKAKALAEIEAQQKLSDEQEQSVVESPSQVAMQV